MSCFKKMKMFLSFVILLSLGHISAGADEMTEIQIKPDDARSVAAGVDWLMTCIYTPEVVSDVRWIDPNGNEIGNSAKRTIESEPQQGLLLMTLFQISSDDNGIYTCEGFSNSANATISLTRDVVVFVPVEIVDIETIQEFQIGDTVSVICKVIGDPSPDVFWLKDAIKIDVTLSEKYLIQEGMTDLIISNISKEDEGDYTCKARELSKGQRKEEIIEVKVLIPPKIINFEPEVTVVEGNNIVLSCNATGDPEPAFSWYRGDGTIRDESTFLSNGRTAELNNFTKAANEGMYTCVASNKIETDFATLELTVHVKPSFTVAEGDSTEEKGEAMLRCIAVGDPTPQVTFYRDGIMMEGTDMSEIPEELDFFGNDTANTTMGTWSTNREIIYNGNEAVMNFSYTTYADGGRYECRAQSAAGSETTGVILAVEYAPRDSILQNVWTCVDTLATLECYFDANPPANLTWGRYESLDGSMDVESENSTFSSFDILSPPVGYVIEDVNGILTLTVDTTVVPDGYGAYYCNADNIIGSNSASAEIFRARAPEPPSNIQVSDIGTRQATISFNPPIQPLVKIDFYIIKLVPTASEMGTEMVNVDGSDTEYTFTELEHNMAYTVIVEAQNCADTSRPSELIEFTTLMIESPEQVDIVSGKSSEDHDQYVVEWRLNGLGGGEVSKIVIVVKKEIPAVDVSNATTFDEVEEIIVGPEDAEFDRGSYTVEDLDPASRYEISVSIHNEVGSAETKHLFVTAMIQLESTQAMLEPTTVPTTTDNCDAVQLNQPLEGSKENEDSARGERKISIESDKSVMNENSEDSEKRAGTSPTSQQNIVMTQQTRMLNIEGSKGSKNKEVSNYPSNLTNNDVIIVPTTTIYDISNEPDITTVSANTDQDKLSAGSIDGMLIGIIVAVLLLLLIIIDVTCFFTRSWGCTMWIYLHTCGKSKKQKVEDVEEGSAEFRQGQEGKYREESGSEAKSNVNVEEEKQPLAAEAEPVANGEVSKLTPICEQTPLQSDDSNKVPSASGGNTNTEGAKAATSEEPEIAQEKINHPPQATEEESLVKNSNQNEEA